MQDNFYFGTQLAVGCNLALSCELRQIILPSQISLVTSKLYRNDNNLKFVKLIVLKLSLLNMYVLLLRLCPL